ncbi:MAG TPA: hypothetical protein EYP08_07655 [Pyrodictiaceae archaeon]|nr:hypothetical protein [Pyrodictiaceae archaeon]
MLRVVYGRACSLLPRLCPKPLPVDYALLSAVYVAKARILATTMGCSEEPSILREIEAKALQSKGCKGCGAPIRVVDDEYEIVVDSRSAFLRIDGVSGYCKRCYLARRFVGDRSKLRSWIARINRVPLHVVDEVLTEIEQVRAKLGEMQWQVQLSVKGYDLGCIGKVLETLLNSKGLLRLDGTKFVAGKTTKHRICSFPGVNAYQHLLRKLGWRVNADKLIEIAVNISSIYSARAAIVAMIGEELQTRLAKKLLTGFTPPNGIEVRVEVFKSPGSLELVLPCPFDQLMLESALRFLEECVGFGDYVLLINVPWGTVEIARLSL